MTIFQSVRAKVRPVPGDAVIEWCGRTYRACQGERAKLKLTSPHRFPRSVAAIAGNAYGYTTVGLEGDSVVGWLARRQGCAIPALESHQPPRRPGEVGRCFRRSAPPIPAGNKDQEGSQGP